MEERKTLEWVLKWIDGAFLELRKVHVESPEEEGALVKRVNDTFDDLGRDDKKTAFLYLLGKIVRDE